MEGAIKRTKEIASAELPLFLLSLSLSLSLSVKSDSNGGEMVG
jgi:hypothetical protein